MVPQNAVVPYKPEKGLYSYGVKKSDGLTTPGIDTLINDMKNPRLFNEENNLMGNWIINAKNKREKDFAGIKQLAALKNAEKKQDSQLWKKLGNKGLATFSDGVWKANNKTYQNKINSWDRNNMRRTYAADEANQIINVKLNQAQIQRQLPPIVTQILSANSQFSKFGVGPISKNSPPLFVGRWIDPLTSKVRILPTASKKFVSPLSYNQNASYLQAALLNKWNKFVQIQWQYEKFLGQGSTDFRGKRLNALSKKFQNEMAIENVVKWFINQHQLYLINPQLSSVSTQYVMANGLVTEDMIKQLNQPGDAYNLVENFQQQVWDNFQNVGIPNALDKTALQTYFKLQAAVSVYVEKGYTSAKNLYKTLLKASFPDQMSQEDYQLAKQNYERFESLPATRLDIKSIQDFLRTVPRTGIDPINFQDAVNFIGGDDARIPQPGFKKYLKNLQKQLKNKDENQTQGDRNGGGGDMRE